MTSEHREHVHAPFDRGGNLPKAVGSLTCPRVEPIISAQQIRDALRDTDSK